LSLIVKVTPTEDGAILTVNGFDITISVKPSTVLPTPAVPPSGRVTVEFVRSRLTPYLANLTVHEDEEGIVIKPTGFLGRDKFASIAAEVRALGGNYISAGRDSRFVIPKE